MMRCPKCRDKKSEVITTEYSDDFSIVVRRRQCTNKKCKNRWTTVEVDRAELRTLQTLRRETVALWRTVSMLK